MPRKDKSSEANNLKSITAIDFFCGAGGFSLGFKNAGVQILAGVDNDKEALETFRYNFKTSESINYDLSKCSDGFYSYIKNLGNIDIMLGGPPCQGFSIAGKKDINA